MIDKEILKEAIKKAMNNGWDISPWERKTDLLLSCENNLFLMSDYAHYPLLIFSHEFAKAFWGEKIICNECQKDTDDCDLHIWEHYKIAWQYHIQQMVIKENPLEYLEKFLEVKTS